MNDHEDGSIKSTAAIAGHPLHPMLVPFPIAFLVALPVVDAAFWSTGDPFWARAALWLAGAGLLSGLAAAVPGLVDFATVQRIRQHRAAWIHGVGNVLAMVLTFVNLWLRLDDPAAMILPAGLLLSLLVALLLGVTGWYGGELSYRHRVGVSGPK